MGGKILKNFESFGYKCYLLSKLFFTGQLQGQTNFQYGWKVFLRVVSAEFFADRKYLSDQKQAQAQEKICISTNGVMYIV